VIDRLPVDELIRRREALHSPSAGIARSEGVPHLAPAKRPIGHVMHLELKDAAEARIAISTLRDNNRALLH
jgi:hypothetical protein